MFIKIKCSGNIILINTDDIYYITKDIQYLIIRTRDKKIRYRGNLYNFFSQLPNTHFIRCHKSFIVNINEIKEITSFNNTSFNVILKDIDDNVVMSQRALKEFTQSIS